MKIAVMGYGTVGKSLVSFLDRDREGSVKYILEIPEKCTEKRMISDVNVIMNDPEIGIVVDALPAVHPSYDFMKKALSVGKNVVTSNKAALCFGFRELTELAAEKKVSLRYEASCGGTIPCIAEAESLSGSNTITACYGIMNGTTNFILDNMIRNGADFADALKMAQQLGYAEADPTADLSGYDVKNKIVILSNTAYHGYTVTDFPVCGIEKISSDILSSFAKEGKTIKLLGMSVREGDRYALGVAPAVLPLSSLEASVPRNFNMFTFRCTNAGDVKLYGQGAGGNPTADAMLRDIYRIDDKQGSGCRFDSILKYDPSLLQGKGYIGNGTQVGTLSDLFEKAKAADSFFAFEPEFI